MRMISTVVLAVSAILLFKASCDGHRTWTRGQVLSLEVLGMVVLMWAMVMVWTSMPCQRV